MKIKGITIDLGVNTKPVSEALANVNKELRETNKTLNQIDKGLRLDPTNTELLEQKAKYLNKAIEETNKKLDEEKKALGELEKLDGGTGKYEKQIDAVKREIVDTTNKQEAYKRKLEDTEKVTKQLGDSSGGVKGKLGELKDAFFDSSVKAQLMVEGVKLATQALGKFITFIGDAVKASAEYADNILTESVVTGLSTDALQEYQYMAELVDTSVDTITGSLKKLTKNMYSASEGSASASAYFDKLGVSVTDSNGELRDSNEVFDEILVALGDMENETERDAIAMGIFGKSAQDLKPLIAQGADGLEAFRQEAHDMGYVLNGETLEALGTMDDSFQRLTRTSEAVKNQIGGILAPVISEIADRSMEWVQSINWEEVGQKVNEFIQGIVLAIEYIKPIIAQAIEIIIVVLQGLWNFLKGLWEFATKTFEGIVSAINTAKENLSPIIDTIVGFFQKLWDIITDVIGVVQKFIQVIGGAIDSVKNFFSSGFERIGNFFGNLFGSGGFSSGGFGTPSFASGGYTTMNLSTSVVIQNYGQPISRDIANDVVDIVNQKLGRLLK